MKLNISGIGVQVLIWVGFLLFPFLLSPETGALRNFLHSTPMQKEVIHYLLLIGFFYTSYHFLIPEFYVRSKYGWLVVMITALFFTTAYLPAQIIRKTPDQEERRDTGWDRQGGRPPLKNGPPPAGSPPDHRLPNPDSAFSLVVTKNIFSFLLVFFAALVIRVNYKLRQTEKEKIKAELSYLKAQINPHFLFNTLNNIYSLAIEGSSKTPAAIVQLSQMMRYVLYESAQPFVSLTKELNYIEAYMGFQQMRFEGSVPISYTVQGNTDNKKIAPLLLIPLIENAFKHGANAEEDAAISVTISVAENELSLNIYNKKVTVQPETEAPSGIGVENTRSRLELLYPGQYKLAINDTPKDHTVHLILFLL